MSPPNSQGLVKFKQVAIEARRAEVAKSDGKKSRKGTTSSGGKNHAAGDESSGVPDFPGSASDPAAKISTKTTSFLLGNF